MTGNGIFSSTPSAPSPRTFKNLSWNLSHGVRVRTHQYDDTLYAFEVTQRNTCLGTIIPQSIGDMERMKYVLDNDLPIDGFECNDDFGTLIHVNHVKQAPSKG